MLQFGQVMVSSVASRVSKELLQTRHEELFLISTPTHFAVMRLSSRVGDDKCHVCRQFHLSLLTHWY